MTGTPVRTRIAPSPTGFLHLGTARTALYSWAYARHHGGAFVLRIEDTDVARSTQDSVDQILAAMQWLGLDYDEGPIYQMQRLDRYREVAERMLAEGTAYHCYCTPAELEQMKDAQRARGDKALYDGRWRPAPGKQLPPVPEGVAPVLRFCNPPEGDVTWDDLVKGPISINNREIDDLIIVRADGVPTYNFAVVVDDWDMAHHACVPRRRAHQQHAVADQHLPRARRAVAAVRPCAGDPGRRRAEALQAARRRQRDGLRRGRLPARGHAQLPGAAGLEPWRRRAVHARAAGGMVRRLAPVEEPGAMGPGQAGLGQCAVPQGQARRRTGAVLVAAQLRRKRGIEADGRLPAICALFKDRCDTTVALADWAAAFYADVADRRRRPRPAL